MQVRDMFGVPYGKKVRVVKRVGQSGQQRVNLVEKAHSVMVYQQHLSEHAQMTARRLRPHLRIGSAAEADEEKRVPGAKPIYVDAYYRVNRKGDVYKVPEHFRKEPDVR
jgi:hypothetical protein